MTDKNNKGVEPGLKMATDLGPNTVEQQAAQNCKDMYLLSLESFDGSGKIPERVDCSKLKVPKGTSLNTLERQGEALKHARAQLKMIDNRRAY